MILEGNERGFGAELARHLLNPRDNDHVHVHAIDGFVAEDLYRAFAEAEAISGGTQCQKYLFSLSLNPPPGASAPVEDFEAAIAAAEAKLGLSGQPRAVVFHEKNGRRHAHCVWSRIDAQSMKAIKLSHYKRKLMDISRDLYRSHDWEMPEGFRDTDARAPLNYSRQEAGQAKRAKRDPRDTKAMFQHCWASSDSKSAFAAALWEHGFLLARGTRRSFVAVDETGKVWPLSRWCSVKPEDLRARLGSADDFWSVEDASAAYNDLRVDPVPRKPTAPDPEFERRRASFVERQRLERSDLRSSQEVRRIKEVKDRQARRPKGLKAAWIRMTGQYQKVVAAFAEEEARARNRDLAEQQALIDRHLAERRALERELAQSDLLADPGAVFDAAIKPDPRQHLVLPADDIPFSRDQLLRDPALILDHISHKQARFDRADILRALVKRISDPMALKAAADMAMASQSCST